MYQELLDWMKLELQYNTSEYIMSHDVEPSATLLAESAIVEFDLIDAWADETHSVWDAAVDATEAYMQDYV